MRKIFTLLLVLFSLFSFSQSTTVVISQVYGGGGGSTGTYKYDYVELHNVSSTSQSLTGMSLQYGSSTGNFGNSTTAIYAFPSGTSIPAGGYLLVQLGSAGTGGALFPVTADLITGNISMAAGSGKIALVNGTTAVGCGATATPCTLPNPLYIDVVAYGATNNAEGGALVNNGVALTSVQGAVRKNNGCTDTDNNNADFDVVTAPVPRNSATTVNICGAVPTPTTTSISPSSATAGGAAFTLTVNGTNFVSGSSTVTWNGSPRTTTFVSATQLTAAITAADIATAGTAAVGVTTTGASAASNTQTFTISAPAPVLSAGTLTAFGNVCVDTTAGPNSFTITGTNLTNGNITVGPLAGYTFSTDAAGTYTPSLTLTQAGGTYSQAIYVKFTPTAVQSYDGSIPVSGGGVTTAINVAASGSGVSTAPTVTTGAASAVTFTTATAAGTIMNTGCTSVTAYGIEYSTTQGFAGGNGTKVAATNLSNNAFSADLGGLTQGTIYYYRAYATNAGGTSYGDVQSFTTATPNPSITLGTLAPFGDACLNTTPAAGSFTITGSNLIAGDITVGPLVGYTFSTTANGSYTSSLSLPQGGGSYSQTIYVKFTPTAAQSYNSDIAVSGGGVTTPVNVAASGAGVNTPPSVLTGIATNITSTSATVADTISSNGCSAVTAYGIEYSTNSGFADGTGTKVASNNLNGTSFSVALSGLTPSTTYYYKAYATNAGGTTYGAQKSFPTLAPPPPVITVTPLAAFNSSCLNTPVGPNSFTVTGVNLTTANITVGPLAGYSFATTANGTYSPSLTLTPAAGAINQTVYVKFTPTAAQSYNGNIPVAGGGVTTTVNVAATATGVNTTPTVVTGNATNVTTTSAVLAGSITANGCSNVTSYGIEYSGVNNFDQGTGTKINATNLGGNSFSVSVNNLVQGATYYYRAYALNSGGIAYGPQQTFTVTAIPNTFVVYPNPINRGRELRFSTTNLNAGYHGVILYNSSGTKVFEKGFNVQSNFINDRIIVPGALTPGVYWVQLISNTAVIGTKTIIVL